MRIIHYSTPPILEIPVVRLPNTLEAYSLPLRELVPLSSRSRGLYPHPPISLSGCAHVYIDIYVYIYIYNYIFDLLAPC